jgi:DNA polymerase III epsilon subunit-like protein
VIVSQKSIISTLTHLNGHLLCAIDVETTGKVAGYHDVIQVAIIPLDADIRPYKTMRPLFWNLKPKRPENFEPEALARNKRKIVESQLNGICPYDAADLFDTWFQDLKLGYEKRIIPLAHNWPFDRGFVADWLGPETFNQCFDARYRDTMVVASFANDLAEFRHEPFPYAKVELQYLATTLKIQIERPHTALDDALGTAEVYRELIKRHL